MRFSTLATAILAFVAFSSAPVLAQSVDCSKVSTIATADTGEFASCLPSGLVSDAPADPALLNELFGGAAGFGIDLRGQAPNVRGFIGFNVATPGASTSIAPEALNFYAGDYAGDDFTKVYAVNALTAPAIPQFYTIDPATGIKTLVATTTLPAGSNPLDMAWDYTTSTMYLTASGGTPAATSLYTLNLTTGATTLVAQVVGTGFVTGINLLAHPFTGVLYSVDVGNDILYSINKTTGAATQIGPIGVNIGFAQGADFDNSNGTAYLCAYIGGGVNALRTVDLITGATTSVGSFPNQEVDICAIGTALGAPPTGPVLTVSPGTIDFGTNVSVGQTSAPQTVTMSNSGTTNVVITSITVSGAPFTINTTGTNLTIAPGTATTFTVSFLPTSGTPATGTVTVASNSPNAVDLVALRGTGDARIRTDILSGTTVGGPTFNRGTSSITTCAPATGTTGGAVAYRAIPFSVTTAGLYTITAQYAAGFDGYIMLYTPSFDPANSCLNKIAFDDDEAIDGNPIAQGSRIVDQQLAAGQYVLVITGFNDAAQGAYTGYIQGPAAVMFNPVASEGSVQDARTFLSASPNPASSAARVRFASAEAQTVSVAVYDVTGRQVATLFQGAVAADQQMDLVLNTSTLAPGVYVVRATGTSLSLTQRVTVVR